MAQVADIHARHPGGLARRPAPKAELELAPVALPADHGLKVAQGVFVEGEILEGEVVA